jgi:hypothetical protein
VLQYAIATARMQGPLKGNGAVGPCAFVEGRSAASLLRSPDNRPGPETAKQTCEIRRQVGLSAGRGVPDDDLLRRERKSTGIKEMDSMPSTLSSLALSRDRRGRSGLSQNSHALGLLSCIPELHAGGQRFTGYDLDSIRSLRNFGVEAPEQARNKLTLHMSESVVLCSHSVLKRGHERRHSD